MKRIRIERKKNKDKRERREGERVDDNKLRTGLIVNFLYSII
jgi:uncharacterized protein YeeX (DUF496 family)